MRKPSTEETSPTNSPLPEPEETQRKGEGPVARRGLRTAVLSAMALVALVSLAVGVLFSSLSPPEGTASGRRPATESSGTANGPQSSGAEAPAIVGTVSLAPELRGRVSEGDTLFIIARKSAGGTGAPFAVKRIAGPNFPLQYRLGPEDVMMAGAPFEGNLRVSVRLSKTGAAGPAQPGDLEGEHPGQVAVGARGVDIVIARVD